MIDDESRHSPPGDAFDADAEVSPRVLRVLRSAERSDPTFSARVMSAVHAEARGRRKAANMARRIERGWWRRRTLVFSPAEGLAMAAGIAGLVLLGSATGRRLLAVRRPPAPAVVAAARPETVHVVRFVFTDREARAVSLVGDFNAWARNATPLVEGPHSGTWIVSVPLPPGRHEYAFVVERDGQDRWTADPLTLPVRDEFGTESSVVTVGAGRNRKDPFSSS